MIQVELKRIDDGVVVGTVEIDETLCYPTTVVIPPSNGSKVLNLLRANVDYIQLDNPITYSGEFDFEITTQEAIEDSSYIPLFGDVSVGSRVLVSGNSSKLGMNCGAPVFYKTGLALDMTAKTTTRIYKDSVNDIYIQINGGTPIFVDNQTTPFVLSKVAKSQAREFTGYIHSFRIGTETFSLGEQSGNILTSDSGNMTTTIVTNGNTTYLNDSIWKVPPEVVNAVEVINKGVPNNNTFDLSQRLTDVTNENPDLTIIMIGANDCLNTSKWLSLTAFQTNLQTCVDAIITNGSDVLLAYTPPTVSDKKKEQNDYTPMYGDESLLDLNVKLDEYRAVMNTIAASTLKCGVADTLAPFTANNDPNELITSFLRNPLNAGGAEDYVHPTVSGQEAIANSLSHLCTGYSKIVCFGDSITYGVGATPYSIKLSELLNS